MAVSFEQAEEEEEEEASVKLQHCDSKSISTRASKAPPQSCTDYSAVRNIEAALLLNPF